MLKFFHFHASCSLASHIALEEAGADYVSVPVDLANAEQTRPEFLAINPKGRVPALGTEQGILSETPAILVYIAQRFSAAALAPLGDIFAFARMQAFNSYLASTVHVAHAHRVRGYRWADDPAAIEEMKRKTPETMAACFELIERELFVGPWVLGDDYSVSDPYLFTMARWLRMHEVDIKRFPKVHEHQQRMLARPAVQRVMAAG